jgi:putative effector of murein hydrolase LrgA (UPF0299 family)
MMRSRISRKIMLISAAIHASVTGIAFFIFLFDLNRTVDGVGQSVSPTLDMTSNIFRVMSMPLGVGMEGVFHLGVDSPFRLLLSIISRLMNSLFFGAVVAWMWAAFGHRRRRGSPLPDVARRGS